MSERRQVVELSLMRGLAYLAVILQHAIGGLPSASPRLSEALFPVSAVLLLVRFALPVFVFASGYLMVDSLLRDGYASFARRRLRGAAVPYLTWSVLYLVGLRLFDGTAGTTTGALLADLGWAVLQGSAAYHLWFMVMIVQLYLALPPVILALRGLTGARLWAAVAGLLALHLALLWIDRNGWFGVGGTAGKVLGFADRTFPLWLMWAALGAVAALHRDAIESWIVRWQVWLFLAAGGVTAWLLFDLRATLGPPASYAVGAGFSSPFRLPMVPLFLLALPVLFLVCRQIARIEPLRRPLQLASDQSFIGYFIHPAVLWFAFPRLGGAFPRMHPLVLMLAVFAIAAVASTAAGAALRKWRTPAGELLGGR